MASPTRNLGVRRWLLLILSCLITQHAAAQGAPKTDSAEYRELIRKALEEYELGNWAEAKLFFSDAHRLFPNARTLRGLGLVAYSLRDYVSATDQLAQSLSSNVRPLTKELRGSTQQILEQSRRFEARLSVAVVPRDATLRVDDEPPVKDASGKVRVNPGLRELIVSRQGYRSETRRVSLDAGAERPITIELNSVQVAAAVTSAPSPQPTAANIQPPAAMPEAAPESSDETGRGIGPWILIGVSGAVTIGGGVLLSVGLSDVGTVEDSKPRTPWSSVSSEYDRSAMLTGIGITMLAVGGAGLIAGFGWQLWPSDKKQDVALRISPQGVQFRMAL
jgi:hypothetical protein